MSKGKWVMRWRAGFDPSARRAWIEHASARELAEYCVEHQVSPVDLHIGNPDKLSRVLTARDQILAQAAYERERAQKLARKHAAAQAQKRKPGQSRQKQQLISASEEPAPDGSGSLIHIKDRTRGRNRKARRGA